MDVEDFLLKLLPTDYGRIECNLNDVTQKSIGIVIPSYGRPQYVKKCLASLKKSDLDDCILCFVDETDSTARDDFDDYYCFYNIDSSGHDIKRLRGDIREIRTVANQMRNCVAFNRSGWLKHKLKAAKRFTKLKQTRFGFYIKKSFLDKYEKLRKELEALEKGLETKPDRKTVDLVKQYQIDDVPIIKIFKRFHGSMYDSIQKGLDLLYAACKCNWFMILDSDTTVKEVWVSRIKELQMLYESHYPTITTGFNTLNHPIIEVKKNHCIKRSIGGINMFFNKKIYEEVVRNSLLNTGWDFTVVEKMRELDGIIVSTTPSVVQHIGQSGSWSNEDRLDIAFDY